MLESLDPARLASIDALVEEIERNGYAVIENFFSTEQLGQARAFVDSRLSTREPGFFALHGTEAMPNTLISHLAGAAPFRALLADLCETGKGLRVPPTESVFPVLRCLRGASSQREHYFFHFDATAITALAPVAIPTEGQRGDLLVFPALRPLRRSTVRNLVDKALLQNRLSQKLTGFAVHRGWLKPLRVPLVPGNLYLFWGYCSLHANEPCDPDQLRATVLYHFGKPHNGSALARLLLGGPERRARSVAAGALPEGEAG